MKSLKKVISLLLVLTTVFSFCGTAMAAQEDSYEHLPQVYINGIESKKIYYKDDPEQKSLFYPITAERLTANLGNMGDYIKTSLKNGDIHIVYNCLYSWMWDTFGMIALDKDGYTMSDEVTVEETKLNYRGDGKYVFDYDCRLSPVAIAKELDEYIKMVQEDSGSERFELVGSSYGSAVALAYINEYRDNWDNIDSVVFCVPSINGVDFAGELFSGTFSFDPDAIEAFVSNMLSDEEAQIMMSLLNKSGILDVLLACAVEPLVRAAALDALKAVIHDIFGTFPSMWSFVKEDCFEQALVNIYGEDYADPNHEYAVLIDTISYYHNEIQLKADEIISDAKASGINMNVICKYGAVAIPLSKTGNVTSDGFIALSDASFGATVSMNGEALPDGYTQKLYPEADFMSVDGCIDASTGLLPYNTWYIKNLEHGTKNDGYYELINAVAYNNIDVNSDESYPQFLELSAEDSELLIPLQKPPAQMGLIERIIYLIKSTISRIIENIRNAFL